MKLRVNFALANILFITLALCLANAIYYAEVHHEGNRLAQAGQEEAMQTFRLLLSSPGSGFRLVDGQLVWMDRVPNNDIPDAIHRIFGCDASIYLGKTRVATSLLDESGKRLVGTQMQGIVLEDLFQRRTTYRGKALIAGQLYFSAYDPIMDAAGEVIGALSVERNSLDFFSEFDPLRNDVVFGSLFVECILVLVSIVFFREQKKQETLLLENEKKYRDLFESSAEGIFLFRQTITDCNDTAAHLLGYRREELIGRNPMDLFPAEQPDGRSSAMAARDYTEAALNGSIQFFPWRYRRADGHLLDTEVSLKSLRIEGNRVVQATVRDVTERVRTLRQLQESEENYRVLFAKMLNGSALHEIVFDAAGRPVDYRFLQVNAAFEQHTGLKRENLIGRTVGEVLPGIEDFWLQRYARVALSEKPDHFESYSSSLGRWFEVSAYCPRKGQFVAMVADISERKEAEEKLQDSERRYRALFDTTGTATILIEEDTTISLANREFENLSQFARQEIEGRMPFPEFFDAESRKRMLAYHRDRRIEPSQAPATYECILLRKDGASRHLLAHASLIPGTERSIVSFHDITPLKTLRNSLQAQLTFLQTLIDTIPNPIFFKDRAGRYLGCNQAFEEVIGMTREALIDKTVFEISPGPLARKYFEMDEKLFSHPGVQTYGAPVRSADGSLREMIFYKATFDDREGKVGGMVGVMLDVTELKRSERALRESEERFHQIFTQHLDAAILLKPCGDAILDANPAAAGMFGYERDEFLSLSPADLIEPADLPPLVAALENGSADFRFEKTVVRRKDGSRFIIAFWGKTVQLHEGQVVFCSIRDVTEKIQLEEAIKSTQAKLIQANKMTALGLLTSSMGHEINNPNSYISVNAAMLADIWNDSLPVLHRYFEENGDFSLGGLPFTEMQTKIPRLCSGILEGSRRIDTIVKDLKNFVREEKNVHYESVSINAVAEQAAAILWHHIHKHTDHFQLSLSEQLPPVRGKAQQLEQVLINLIMNALQSLPGKEAGVTVATRREERMIVMEVRDGGRGMDAQTMKRLAEPFFTTRMQEGGSGLGLYISASIVGEHRGTMEFDSQPGVGTTAVIRLPIAEKT